MPQLNLGLHADYAAILRLCTGVDWHHRHLVSKRKYPEIYSYYFTGSYSLDYSTVRYSPLHYLILIVFMPDYVQISYKMSLYCCKSIVVSTLFEVLNIKLSLHKLISELNTHSMGVDKVNKHSKLKIKECSNVKN